MKVLTLNCGSSSVKYSLWDVKKEQRIARGIVERVGLSDSFIEHETADKSRVTVSKPIGDHSVAINSALETINKSHTDLGDNIEIDAVGHRVVHGGNSLIKSTIINQNVKEEILRWSEFAPLHNPSNLLGIETAMELLPDIPHVAIFDTTFLSTIPPHVYTYAIPKKLIEQFMIRRYGFHGTSHLYVSRRVSALLRKKPSKVNSIILHIGNGVSITAVKEGLAYDHSMGLTPLEGAVMGTRCGDLDPSIPLYLMRKLGLMPDRMEDMLNRKSGLLGITEKYSDRRDILRNADTGDGNCKLAFEVECYRLKKYIGAYVAALGRVDAIAFTAATGERSPRYRESICSGLEELGIVIDGERNEKVTGSAESLISSDSSKVRVYVIPTDEEVVLAEDTVAILEGRYAPHWEFEYSFDKIGSLMGNL